MKPVVLPDCFDESHLSPLLARCGTEVRFDRSVRLASPAQIAVGSHVRVDAFCVLAAGHTLTVGNYVHIAAGCFITASGGAVVFEDFSGLSSGVKIYTASDDYKDGFLTNPTVPIEFRNLSTGPVALRRHAIVGANAVIMPGVTIGTGAAVGAGAFVSRDVPDYAIVAGSPARVVGTRNADRLRELEQKLLSRPAP